MSVYWVKKKSSFQKAIIYWCNLRKTLTVSSSLCTTYNLFIVTRKRYANARLLDSCDPFFIFHFCYQYYIILIRLILNFLNILYFILSSGVKKTKEIFDKRTRTNVNKVVTELESRKKLFSFRWIWKNYRIKLK